MIEYKTLFGLDGKVYIFTRADLPKQEFTDYGYVRLGPYLETLNKSNKSKFIAIGTQSENNF